MKVMAGLTVICTGPILERMQLIFDLHDLNGASFLTYDEVVVAIFLTVSATVLISGKGTPTRAHPFPPPIHTHCSL